MVRAIPSGGHIVFLLFILGAALPLLLASPAYPSIAVHSSTLQDLAAANASTWTYPGAPAQQSDAPADQSSGGSDTKENDPPADVNSSTPSTPAGSKRKLKA